MKEIVDKIHEYMWAFCQKAEIDVDPVLLKRSIGQQISGALLVVSPQSLERIGHAKLAVMIDVAARYEVTLAEMLNESLIQGAENSATLCRDIRSRKESTRRISRRPRLQVVR